MIATHQPHDPGRGRWIPWTFVAGFVVVCIVNGVMIWSALESWTGLETDDPYQRGITYNRDLAQARAQEKLDWHVGLHAVLDPGFHGRIEVTASEPDGRTLDGAAVHGWLVRPTQEGHDLTFDLQPLGHGRYAASFEAPFAGIWDARIQIARGNDTFYYQQRLDLR